MSGNVKNKKKKQFNYSFVLILVGIAFLLLVCLKLFFKKDYYTIESRVEKVNTTKITNNSDFKTIGWLRVQGTNLDMPIVWSSTKSTEYPVELKHFAWSLGNDEHFHNKINIMGHNIFNLSSQPKLTSDLYERFEELMAFTYYDFAKTNKYIQLTIDGKEYIYKIFSVGFISTGEMFVLPHYDDYKEKDIKYQLDLFKKYNLYNYDVDVNKDDSFISLITCTRFFGESKNVDFYVNGRLLRDGEKIDNYKVTKSDNYEEIEKILKGDGDNEEDDSL